MTLSESRKCKEFLDAMFHQLSQPYLTSTKACVYIKADKEMVANIAKCFARAGLLNVELAKRTKGYYFDLPSSPTRRELKNKRCSCGHNSTRPHQLEPRHWWDFAKLFPFAYGPNGLLTSMWIGLKSAIKIWMGIRSKSTLPALSWTSWRPTGRNGALSSRTLCLLQSFLLTSIILSYYVSRATYVDQAWSCPSSCTTGSSAEECVSQLLSGMHRGCILCLHLGDTFWIMTQFLSLLMTPRHSNLLLEGFTGHYFFAERFPGYFFSSSSLYLQIMSGVKRDSAMANLSWPASSNRSASANADTDATMDPTSGTSSTQLLPAMLPMRRKWSLLLLPQQVYTLTPVNHMDPYQWGEYFTEQMVHTITFKIYTYNGERMELWVNEVNNNGFSRLQRPEHFFFRLTEDWWSCNVSSPFWLLACILWLTTSTRRISLCWLHGQPTSCDDRFPGTDGSCTGFSIASIPLWPMKSQVLLPPLLLGDHAWHLYGPAAGSCSGTWKFGILEPFWFGCVWDNVIGSRDTVKKPCFGRVCVCGEHLHRCKTSFGMFFNHAGGRSVMVSLLPTKTPTIDGDTRLG